MKRALELSEKGRKTAPPNPWVGCVIVKNGKIIGEGYHEFPGNPHAEVNAFKNMSDQNTSDQNTEVYVTLEPCSHFGRTPPCVDLLIDRKVKKVYIGLLDPDSRVMGNGIQKLKDNDIEVVTGLCEDLIRESLKPYLYHRTTSLPFITLKLACSFDGMIQDIFGKSQWISNEKSRTHCHILRSENMGIMVGTNTILKDNPSLTVRNIENSKQPIKIILDKRGKLYKELNVFADNNCIIFTNLTETKYMTKTNIKNVKIYTVDIENNNLNLTQIIKKIGELNIINILVEGGIQLHTSFLENKLAQEMYVYRSGHLLGSGLSWNNYFKSKSISENKIFKPISVSLLDDDILEHYSL